MLNLIRLPGHDDLFAASYVLRTAAMSLRNFEVMHVKNVEGELSGIFGIFCIFQSVFSHQTSMKEIAERGVVLSVLQKNQTKTPGICHFVSFAQWVSTSFGNIHCHRLLPVVAQLIQYSINHLHQITRSKINPLPLVQYQNYWITNVHENLTKFHTFLLFYTRGIFCLFLWKIDWEYIFMYFYVQKSIQFQCVMLLIKYQHFMAAIVFTTGLFYTQIWYADWVNGTAWSVY